MSELTLVTGASGFIGSHLTRALVSQGRRVRALAVDSASAEAARALGAEPVLGDLADSRALERAVAGVSRVYHLAAQVRPLKSFYRRDALARSYKEVNVDGTARLARACRGRVEQFIFFSSIAAAGVGRDLYEDSPCRPATAYGESKRQAEQALLEAFGRDRFPVKILRPGQAYGPGNLPMLIFYRLVKHGILPLVGDGSNHIPFCYVDDIVKIALLVEQKGSPGEIYFGVNDPLTFRQFVAAIAEALGRRMPKIAVPSWAFRCAARVKDAAERAVGARVYPLCIDFGVEAVKIASSDWLCRNTKSKERLGFAGQTELAEGARRTIRWYRDNRLL